jgi:chemotaxis protein CheX
MSSSKELLAAGGTHESWSPLLELAVREVFELMLASELTVLASAEMKTPHEVTAMVGLAGKLCGLLSVHCDSKCAALMTSKMLGVPLDKVGSDMCDAMGEISNMVAGSFRTRFQA